MTSLFANMLWLTLFTLLALINVQLTGGQRLFNEFRRSILGPPSDITKHPNWHFVNGEKCGHASSTNRIIGGMEAALGAYPWLARIGYAGGNIVGVSYRCGGAVINENTVLTAAHCVTGLPKNVLVAAVQVGELNTDTDPDCDDEGVCATPVQTLKPREIIIHEDYNKQPFKNDISLIRFDKIQLGPWVNPICIMNGPLLTKDFEGKDMNVAGWGIYNISDPKNSNTLMVVSLTVQPNEFCQKEYERHAPIGPTQMCVGGTVGKDSCGGDSGGPLMEESAHDGHARFYTVGIVSFGSKKCGQTQMPGIYTRLSNYLDWLLDNVNENKAHYKVVT